MGPGNSSPTAHCHTPRCSWWSTPSNGGVCHFGAVIACALLPGPDKEMQPPLLDLQAWGDPPSSALPYVSLSTQCSQLCASKSRVVPRKRTPASPEMCSLCFFGKSTPVQAAVPERLCGHRKQATRGAYRKRSRPDGRNNWTGVEIPLDLDPGDWDSNPASGT